MLHREDGPFDAERVASPEIIEKLNEAYNLDQFTFKSTIIYLMPFKEILDLLLNIQVEQSPNLLCQDYQQL